MLPYMLRCKQQSYIVTDFHISDWTVPW